MSEHVSSFAKSDDDASSPARCASSAPSTALRASRIARWRAEE